MKHVNVSHDSHGRRVVKVVSDEGRSVEQAMIAAAMSFDYEGRKARGAWMQPHPMRAIESAQDAFGLGTSDRKQEALIRKVLGVDKMLRSPGSRPAFIDNLVSILSVAEPIHYIAASVNAMTAIIHKARPQENMVRLTDRTLWHGPQKQDGKWIVVGAEAATEMALTPDSWSQVIGTLASEAGSGKHAKDARRMASIIQTRLAGETVTDSDREFEKRFLDREAGAELRWLVAEASHRETEAADVTDEYGTRLSVPQWYTPTVIGERYGNEPGRGGISWRHHPPI